MSSRISRSAVRVSSRIPGCATLLRRARSSSLAIPMYHGVLHEPLPVFNWCQLELARFEEQIEFLTSEYQILPLREVVDRLWRKLPLPERAVAITFDDGFRSVYTTAFPVLERYQVPFTVFLITSLVGSNQPAWPERLFSGILTTKTESVTFAQADWPLLTSQQRAVAYPVICSQLKRMGVREKDEALQRLLDSLGRDEDPGSVFALMSWDEIHRLSRSGLADFGSHTHTHEILSQCDDARQKAELQQSRGVLLQHLENADLFAYPNGTAADFTELTKLLLRELGYRCGLSTIDGLNGAASDLYELRRVNVGADATLAEFELLMLGF
jgi:peptidoglycan/xylan/chitin deacetylase (PgdA/CDA1 family)